ncbi:hypothetical protein [Streptomyces sp. NPDC094468]|uniref:hypothetical protein n=1 Tax=Streptomyces sp. NPDC094468 TaxID=3366066 RepID=UPI0038241567
MGFGEAGFPRSPRLQQRDFPRDFRLTECRFAVVTLPGHVQPEFQPVTETVSERTGLLVLTLVVFLVGIGDRIRGRNSVRSQ